MTDEEREQMAATLILLANLVRAEKVQPPPGPCWMTAKELGPLLGLTPRWLVRHAGELPFARRVPNAHAFRFDPAAARRWMQTRSRP